jgi:hypothetical protein
MRCSRVVRAVALGLFAALAACAQPTLCLRNSDCRPGQVCSANGSCVAAPDAGGESTADGGSATGDAASGDAAAVDAAP